MSGGRSPERAKTPGEILRDSLVGGGGLALMLKGFVTLLPETFPLKQTLDQLAPAIGGGVGAGISWIWNGLAERRRRINRDNAFLHVEERYADLIMDPDVSSEERQQARETLSRLRLHRADEAQAAAKELPE